MVLEDRLLLEMKEAAEESLTIHLVPDFLKSPKYRIFVHTRRPSVPNLTGVDAISDMSIQRDSSCQYDSHSDFFMREALIDEKRSTANTQSTQPRHRGKPVSLLLSISECPTSQSSWSDEVGPLTRSSSPSKSFSDGESRLSEPEREMCSGNGNADSCSSSSSGQGSDSSECDSSSDSDVHSPLDSPSFSILHHPTESRSLSCSSTMDDETRGCADVNDDLEGADLNPDGELVPATASPCATDRSGVPQERDGVQFSYTSSFHGEDIRARARMSREARRQRNVSRSNYTASSDGSLPFDDDVMLLDFWKESSQMQRETNAAGGNGLDVHLGLGNKNGPRGKCPQFFAPSLTDPTTQGCFLTDTTGSVQSVCQVATDRQTASKMIQNTSSNDLHRCEYLLLVLSNVAVLRFLVYLLVAPLSQGRNRLQLLTLLSLFLFQLYTVLYWGFSEESEGSNGTVRSSLSSMTTNSLCHSSSGSLL
jgi:hypothetical protein